ncbi:MAG: hypothetical protein KatS3mg109_1545 [Pirellulaceae bacterium]|nr:MAG: hypothetical protein KatS3mg109_1545 [Pirellulaceae bacterium]
MITVEARRFMSPAIQTPRQILGDMAVTALDAQRKERICQAWQDLIDQKLIEWGRCPDKLADEGVEAPSGETIHLAIQLAELMKARSLQPPTSVVPDPNGGIVFERRGVSIVEVIHIWEDGTIEYQLYRGTKLDKRVKLPLTTDYRYGA